jgi:hypothetical protein
VKRDHFPYFTQGNEIAIDTLQVHAIQDGKLTSVTPLGLNLAALTETLKDEGAFELSLAPDDAVLANKDAYVFILIILRAAGMTAGGLEAPRVAVNRVRLSSRSETPSASVAEMEDVVLVVDMNGNNIGLVLFGTNLRGERFLRFEGSGAVPFQQEDCFLSVCTRSQAHSREKITRKTLRIP